MLLKRYFEKYPEDADKVILSIKGGMNPKTGRADGSPDNTRRTLDDSLAQLKGRKKLDIFEFARRDPNVSLETTFGTMDKEYIQTGKLGGISLSEVRAETIHEAVKIAKVSAVEVELSMSVMDTPCIYNVMLMRRKVLDRGLGKWGCSGMRSVRNSTYCLLANRQRHVDGPDQKNRGHSSGLNVAPLPSVSARKLRNQPAACRAGRANGPEEGLHTGSAGDQLDEGTTKTSGDADHHPDSWCNDSGEGGREQFGH